MEIIPKINPQLETNNYKDRKNSQKNQYFNNQSQTEMRILPNIFYNLRLITDQREEVPFLLTKFDMHNLSLLIWMRLISIDCTSIFLTGITLSSSFTLINPHQTLAVMFEVNRKQLSSRLNPIVSRSNRNEEWLCMVRERWWE